MVESETSGCFMRYIISAAPVGRAAIKGGRGAQCKAQVNATLSNLVGGA